MPTSEVDSKKWESELRADRAARRKNDQRDGMNLGRSGG